MRCREVQSKLGLFATGELTPSEYEKLEAHLESCATCREVSAKLRRLENVLGASPVPPVPAGFAARVVARAKQRQAAADQRAPQSRLAVFTQKRLRLAAALAAGLLIGLFMGHQTWRSRTVRPPAAARQPADLLAASGFEYLVEPGGDSLAQAYLGLTTGDR